MWMNFLCYQIELIEGLIWSVSSLVQNFWHTEQADVNKHVIYLSEEQSRKPLHARARERLGSFRQQKPVRQGLVLKERGTLEEIKENQCDCSTFYKSENTTKSG